MTTNDATLPPERPADDATVPPTVAPSPPTSGDDLPRPFGRYVLQKKLGEGGMGAVYLAFDPQLARQVAVKLPFLSGPDAASLRARFLREARSAAALHHPNICPIFDLGEVNGTPYLTMALVAGEPLSARVKSGQLPVAEAVAITRKLALALHEAHARGVIHRDLKPANVMLDDRGEPVLMDFGLARRNDLNLANLTVEGMVMGTPAYMPPEQINGEVARMGPATDVYSLGVVLFELLTGKLPFAGDIIALVTQITADPPPRPSKLRPEVSPQLDQVCLKAMEKKPEDRWASMREFAAALERVAGMATGTIPLTGPTLTLRVEGTPYAYRPAPHHAVITIGRQKRNPGDPPDHGNDFVLRVAGNDQLSARISRRHCEIRRSGSDYFLVDVSKAGVEVNGSPAPKNLPVKLNAGDKFVVAGVITLEVLLQQDNAGYVVTPIVHVPTAAQKTEQIVMEASLGDMVTVE